MSTSDEGTLPGGSAPCQQPNGLPAIPGYHLEKVLGEGGMGTVYLARDEALGRPVAVKVMKAGLPPTSARQFGYEAQVTAILSHPGVPPVHALGSLADGRPFLVMKLIGGETLAEVLRRDPPADRGWLLGVFERVCETVGFAHSRGFIHRDLKPANIMVGAFGEVQVLDWGLAKSVGGPREAEPAPSPTTLVTPEAIIATAAGIIKGTPAYMAPEQARGEPVDCRADVFALGGILAMILTGQPPFAGETVRSTLMMAGLAELDACYELLDDCAADDGLVDIAFQCLEPLVADRYATGAAVAIAVAAYRAGVEERLRAAERAQAAAAVRAAEQRKRRRLWSALAVAVLLLVSGGGAFAWYSDHQRGQRALAEREIETERRLKAEQAVQGVDAGLRLATDLRRQYKFKESRAALAQAAESAKAAPERRAEVEQALTDLTFAETLDGIRYRKWIWVPELGGKGDYNTRIAAPEYRAAFAAYGVNVAAGSVAAVAERIVGRAVRAEMVAAVDDWALFEGDESLRDRLLAVARAVDPGPWTDRLRTPANWTDKAAVASLAQATDPATAPPAVVSVIATLMQRNNLDATAMLTTARTAHPDDFELAFTLGRWLSSKQDGQQVGPFDAARALRKDNVVAWMSLSRGLLERRDMDGARAVARKAADLGPAMTDALVNLGHTLMLSSQIEDAAEVYRRVIRLDPRHMTAHNQLSAALYMLQDIDGAITVLRRVTEFAPNEAGAHANLASFLHLKRDHPAVIAACQRALALDPRMGSAHFNLGRALYLTKDLSGAITALRRAIELNQRHPAVYFFLGNALSETNRTDDAIRAYQAAVDLDPKFGDAHLNLGAALHKKGDLAGAVAHARRAVELAQDPTLPPNSPAREPNHVALAYNNLGNALRESGDLPGAIAALRQAVKLNPKHAKAHANLSQALQMDGDISGAREALREAARIDPKYAPLLDKRPLPVAPLPRPVAP